MRENIQRPDVKTVERAISEKDLVGLRGLVDHLSAPDLADLLLQLNERDRFVLFRVLPRKLASEVFAFLDPKYRDEIIRGLTAEETRKLLEDLHPDERTELFEDLPGQAVQRLLNLLSPEDRKEALQLLGYPPGSVGRLMTPDYVAVRKTWTIARALQHIRSMGRVSETINDIYVVDDHWKLLDALEIRKFILADPDQRVEDLMDFTFVSIHVYADREEAVQLMQRYDLESLPVVDDEGVLLGIVTIDDIMDVAEEEVTEDFHKVVAVAPFRTSYRDAGTLELYKKRIPWLLGLVFLNLFSSGVIASFENTLASMIALAFFIPLLIDSGGNVGSQAATIIIRALATGDVKPGEWVRALVKELGVSLAIGLTMAIASSLVGMLRGGWQVGLVVGLSMFAIVIFSNIVGYSLPFILYFLKLDPASASSPLITTIADILGLAIYFTIATILLRAFGKL